MSGMEAALLELVKKGSLQQSLLILALIQPAFVLRTAIDAGRTASKGDEVNAEIHCCVD